jgi:hypothetical protein
MSFRSAASWSTINSPARSTATCRIVPVNGSQTSAAGTPKSTAAAQPLELEEEQRHHLRHEHALRAGGAAKDGTTEPFG